MAICVFFGHRECYDLEKNVIIKAIEGLVRQGVDTFYVGNQGQFDAMVYGCLRQLKTTYPQIQFAVVLAYIPMGEGDSEDTMYPEAVALGPPRYAIERRNRWLIEQADHVICYVRHTWGGAYKFSRIAKRMGKTVINLGGDGVL